MTTVRQTECKHDTKLMILNRISGCVKAQELAREAAQQLGGEGGGGGGSNSKTK